MLLPNFLIIGAPKCGTTSLQSYLAQHPDVFFSKDKEPNYFAFAGEQLPEKGPVSPELMYELIYSFSITDLDTYKKQFEDHAGEAVVGDASVRYLYTEKAASRIKETVPNAKMVAVLREPVGRLYSHYCMNRQYQIEPLSLMEAIEAEPKRIADRWGWDWHYTAIGRYSEQIKRFRKMFPEEQLKVYLYDDYRKDPVGMMRDICGYLGIDQGFTPDMSKRGKPAYFPRNLALDRWVNRKNRSRKMVESLMTWRMKTKMRSFVKKINQAPVPRIDPGEKVELQKLFHDEAAELSDLLERRIDWYSK